MLPSDGEGAASAAPSSRLWEDEIVLSWVRGRREAGATRDDLVAQSRDGTHGWPIEGASLGWNSARVAIAVLRDRDRTARGASTPRALKDSGKRLHALRARRKAGDDRDDGLYQARVELIKMAGILEAIDFPALGVRDAEQDMLVDIHADMTRVAEWLDMSFDIVDSHLDQLHVMERIRKLRDRRGGTEAEIATGNRLADRLERKLYAKQLAS